MIRYFDQVQLIFINGDTYISLLAPHSFEQVMFSIKFSKFLKLIFMSSFKITIAFTEFDL